MTRVHVVGIGLDGAAGLGETVRQIVAQASLLVGSDRHLGYFPEHRAERWVLGDFQAAIAHLRHRLADASAGSMVVLVSGDPLFFGLGRLLLEELPVGAVTVHPHVSSIQLAFSRIKVPWQDARVISVHGRSLEELIQALQQGVAKIAVLTDPTHTPAAIATVLLKLDLPGVYRCWLCENLGGAEERIQDFSPEDLRDQVAAPLNVLVLLRSPDPGSPLDPGQPLPLLGLPDHQFLSFSDRPGLMTKREIRVLALAELALAPHQVVWDIGAGTGSVSVEMARLCPTSTIYAIEQTAMGKTLIEQNSQRFGLATIQPIYGRAPEVLEGLPDPDRIFIGGSGGTLTAILAVCGRRLRPGGVVVLAVATLEHLQQVMQWQVDQPSLGQCWDLRLLQAQLARSLPIAALTRFAPLNPVTLVTLQRL